MQLKVTPYRVLRWVCILCAALVTALVWKHTPLSPSEWHTIIWFVGLATIAELLAVDLVGSEAVVTPSSPIYWAATCLVGPFPSIIVCVASLCLSESVAFVAFTLSQTRARRLIARFRERESDMDLGRMLRADRACRLLAKIGAISEPKVGVGFVRVFESSAFYVSCLALMVSLSGVFYGWIGGQYMVHGMPSRPLLHFVLPFLVLAAVAVAVDVLLYSVTAAARESGPAARGIRATLLAVHVVFLETGLPIVRAQMFLVIVSLMLTYLYVRLGPWGFVLTTLPVVALRDFYYQWVAEQSAYLDTITTLATYMQHYHPYTRGHLKRVADMSERLARELRLPAESIRHISQAGLLHDIGKIGVSEEILDKTEKLEPEEWEKIKEHPNKGAEIISHLDFLEGIVDWIRYHHKWHDGRGYPETNGKSAIPIEASIIAVADSFDAMIDDRELSLDWVCDSCGYKPDNNERPAECPVCGAAKRRTYRQPKTLDGAVDELRRGSGTQFHPEVVKAFLAMMDRDGVHPDA